MKPNNNKLILIETFETNYENGSDLVQSEGISCAREIRAPIYRSLLYSCFDDDDADDDDVYI
jgi:hypothetical protein